MREILFRGKRLDNGMWMEGYYMYHISRTPAPIGDSVKPEDEHHLIIFDEFSDWNMPRGIKYVEVDASTVGQYTGKHIAERQATDDNAYKNMKRLWQDDLIAIYSIHYDGNDTPLRTRVAIVRVQWDDNYQMLFAKCVQGSMHDIANECDISYLYNDEDYPITYWIEYMENSNSLFWEWEIAGNIYDNPEWLGGEKCE